ncbi:MAG: RNA-binding protein [Bacteroidota bacterium]
MLIRVSNIDRSTTVDDIWDLFAEFGEVEEAEINDDPDPQKDTFTGYVEMPSEDEVDEAIAELNGEMIDGRFLSVKIVTERESLGEQLSTDSAGEDNELDLPLPKSELRRRGIEIDD